MTTVLDDLSGFEFEDVMVDVFRKLHYENVRPAERVADKGRDIVMEEQADGTRRAVVVECKHTDTVGRPVVQKLHSAVATYSYDGPKRGMVATSGEFTGPAKSYVQNLRENDDPYPVELLDGSDLREIARDVGLDLYNGRIEILCDRTLRPYRNPDDVTKPILQAVDDVENLDRDRVASRSPPLRVDFLPHVCIDARIRAVFETSVGIVHSVDEREMFAVRADENGPTVPRREATELLVENLDTTVELDESAVAGPFEDLSVTRFEQTETEYRDWAVEYLRERHTTTVSYTGDNNVTYTKRCEPNRSAVRVRSLVPVYLPRVSTTVSLGGYEYDFAFDAAGPSFATATDDLRRCVHCGTGETETVTFCENCGSINCGDHIETERLVDEPVCTGCAVTERFFLREKYFYDEENLAAFRAEYEEMPIHEKAMENRPLVAGLVLGTLLLLVVLASIAGVI